jgi:hypothetical protein
MMYPVISKYEWNCKKIDFYFLNRRRSQRLKFNKTVVNTSLDLRNLESKISVVVSLFRSDSFLESFLYNILEQSIFQNSDIHFISSHASRTEKKLLNKFCSLYSNCNVTYFEKLCTVYESWNLAISHSKSSLITNMNVDDYRAPNSLELQVDFMENHPAVDIAYQDVLVFRDPNSSWEFINFANQTITFNNTSFIDLAWRGLNYPHHAPVWRKKIHDELGFFNPKFISAGDYDFWLRCALRKKVFAKIKDLHAGYYVNPSGLSTKVGSMGLLETLEIQNYYKKLFLLENDLDINFLNNNLFDDLKISLERKGMDF